MLALGTALKIQCKFTAMVQRHSLGMSTSAVTLPTGGTE